MIKFLFKQEQPRRFDFKTRYYDADKEELNGRISAIKRELDLEKEGVKAPLSGHFSRAWRKNHRRTASNKSSRNVAFIAAALFLIAYFLLLY